MFILGNSLPVHKKLKELKKTVHPVFNSLFQKSGSVNPPDSVTLIAIKDEKVMELWFASSGKNKLIKKYPILAASGSAGPKIQAGDKQVPEGIYRIVNLNPRSKYYLSMRLNYPNEMDIRNSKSKGISDPGNDIYIHGKEESQGCLAMGDHVIEELFYLTGKIGKEKFNVIIMPFDFRKNILDPEKFDDITHSIYLDINSSLSNFFTE